MRDCCWSCSIRYDAGDEEDLEGSSVLYCQTVELVRDGCDVEAEVDEQSGHHVPKVLEVSGGQAMKNAVTQ